MRRWSHLHSGATGGLVLALASGHLIWLLTITLAVGITIGASWRGLRKVTSHAGSIAIAKIATERERAGEVRSRRRRNLERSRSLRSDRDKIERVAYWRGVGDGDPR